MAAAKVKTKISLFIGAILILLMSMLFFALSTMSRVKSNLAIQVHTRTIIITLKDNLIYLLNAETGERGFIITGDSSYLQPYSLALDNISSNVTELHKLVEGNRHEQQQLDTLGNYIDLKLSYIKNLIELKKQGDEQNIKTMLSTGKGKYFMDQYRVVNKSMQEEEEALFQERKISTNKSIERAKIIFTVEGIFALLATVFLAAFIIRELDRRSRTEKIITANNMELERKNKEIEQFAYIASHDLQEPLRTISNFSMLLTEKLETTPDSKAREYIGLISGGANRMSNLIFDLLQYSRIGKDLTRSKIDCNKLLSEILSDLSASIQESGAQIHTSKLPVINGYPSIKSLFQNLLSNALKFHKPGVIPVIYIFAKSTENEFIFSIRDNGIGIEKEYNERIFTIFQRLHSREEFPGTGIGLAQCKKIVELHGGKIWVESEQEKGTIFNFTILRTKTK